MELKNIENLSLDSPFEIKTVAVFISNGETYHSTDDINKDLLKELSDLKISRNAFSKNLIDDMEGSHTLILQSMRDSEPLMHSYLNGTYIQFNSDFTCVWVSTEEKSTSRYKVAEPQRAKEIYDCFADYTQNVSATDEDAQESGSATANLQQLKDKYPMYFDLPTPKGLEVYVWKDSENSYSCGLLPGINFEHKQEEIWALFEAPASLTEMQAIVASYFPDITQRDVVVCPTRMLQSNYSDVVVVPILTPHSRYVDIVDEAYREEITNLFWSDFPEQ